MIGRIVRSIAVLLIFGILGLVLLVDLGVLHGFVCMLFLLLLGSYDLVPGVWYLYLNRANSKVMAAVQGIRTVLAGLLCCGAICVLNKEFTPSQMYCVLGIMYWLTVRIVIAVIGTPYTEGKGYKLFCAAVFGTIVLLCWRIIVIVPIVMPISGGILESDLFLALAVQLYIPFLFTLWEAVFGLRYLFFEKSKSALKTVCAIACVALGIAVWCGMIRVLFLKSINNYNAMMLLTNISFPVHIVNLLTDRNADA